MTIELWIDFVWMRFARALAITHTHTHFRRRDRRRRRKICDIYGRFKSPIVSFLHCHTVYYYSNSHWQNIQPPLRSWCKLDARAVKRERKSDLNDKNDDDDDVECCVCVSVITNWCFTCTFLHTKPNLTVALQSHTSFKPNKLYIKMD